MQIKSPKKLHPSNEKKYPMTFEGKEQIIINYD